MNILSFAQHRPFGYGNLCSSCSTELGIIKEKAYRHIRNKDCEVLTMFVMQYAESIYKESGLFGLHFTKFTMEEQ